MQLLDGSVVGMTDGARESLLSKLNVLSAKALRCLGLAYKDDLGNLSDYNGENHPAHNTLLDPCNYDTIESNLIFVGMAGLRVSAFLPVGLHLSLILKQCIIPVAQLLFSSL